MFNGKFYVPSTVVGLYQEGGEMVMGEPAAVSEDPMMQLIAAAEEALNSQDPEMAFQVCAALMQLYSDQQGGGVEEQEAEEAPDMD